MQKQIIPILLIIFAFACKEKPSTKTKVKESISGTWRYYINGKEELIDWEKHTDSLLGTTINYPKKWNVQKAKDEELFIATIDSNELFVIVQYKKEGVDLSLKSYVKYVYEVLSESKDEDFKEYNLEKISLKSRVAYYMKLFSSKNGIDYVIHAVYTEDDDCIYDFTFRTINSDKNKLNHKVFTDVVYSTSINNQKLFKDSDYVIENKRIKLEEL